MPDRSMNRNSSPPDDHAGEQENPRREFLKWSGIAGSALLLAACGEEPMTGPYGLLVEPQAGKGPNTSATVQVDGPTVGLPLGSDEDILKFALFLELLEAEFYKLAVDEAPLSGAVLEVTDNVRQHEIDHVAFLQAALGPAAFGNTIVFDFDRIFRNQRKYLDTAEMFEQTGVGAYLGALPLISDKNLRSAAGTIATVEARHTAGFRALNHRPDPTPVAFESPLTPQQVVGRIAPFVAEGL